jgi:gas vesicle protein GvpK
MIEDETEFAPPAGSRDKGKRDLQAPASLPERLDCSPENIEQGLAKLVLSLIELLRQLLERQAIRRMEGGSLSEQQVEEMGEALMKLETKIHELSTHFGLTPEDLNLDLGPLGRLLEK